MIAVALKGLMARKVRAVLTAFAVVIGVAMVSGTFILTDTMQKSFDGLFASSFDDTDAVVSGKEVVKDSTAGGAAKVPASLLTRVRALPQVAAAGGTVSPAEANAADIIGSDGKKVAKESVAVSVDRANPRFSPLALTSGAWPRGPGEVVVDAGSAKKEHYATGDTITVSTQGREHRYRLTGTVSFGGTKSLGFASVVAWDLDTAQALFHTRGQFDTLSIAARPGTSQTELANAVRPLVGSRLVVKTSEQQAADNRKNVDKGLSFIRTFLLAFGGIALLVGAFVIFNTLSITVAQRTREFATLRTLGASRRQVMRSVIVEGVAVGLLASVLGLGAGLGIAQGLVALFSVMGVDLPDATTVVAGRTVLVSLLLGTGMTVLASVLPARRATRVPAIAAVREGATLPPSWLAARSVRSGSVLTGLALAVIAVGTFADGLDAAASALIVVVGVLGLLTGIVQLAPHLVRPLVRVVGWPARTAGGVAGELAGANAGRNPRRTASTAAALAIGLTLVTLVAVLGAGVRSSMESAVAKQLDAGYVISGDDSMPFRADEGDRLAKTPGVTAVSHVRGDKALVAGDEQAITGVDPQTIGRFYRFTWVPGSERALDRLGVDGALATKDYAKAHDLRLGSSIALVTPDGTKRTLVLRGIYAPPKASQLLGDVSMSQRGFDGAFQAPKNDFTFLDASPAAGTRIAAATKGLGDAEFHTGAAYPKDSTKELTQFLSMLYVLLGFSIIVSLFGMVNTMVLSVIERTRELGMLRTIGLSRRQSRRMIRHESVITALIGATLGLGLGVFLAALMTDALSSYEVPLTIPPGPVAGFTLVAILAGIGAAVVPARRASRLDVLDALHYE
jgi:putative ABC transport system permease protein